MDWVTITEDDLLLFISGTELETFRTKALQEKQPDPVALTIALGTETVRGAIAAHPENVIGLAGTIPPSLKSAAVDWIVWKIMSRGARVNDPSGARKDAFTAANELFERVASGKRTIEAPTESVAVARSTPTGRWGSQEKLAI